LPVPIQTASLLGIGLLFAGSNQRRTAEVLIGELAAPKTDMVDREAYSLSAGFALGLVCLGQGPYAVGLADLNLADRLTLYMDGGRKPDRATVAGDRIWHSVNSEAGGAAHGQGPTTTTGAAEGKSSTVLEGNKVNVHVTAPSAVMALAMMYMKTNDRGMCSMVIVTMFCGELMHSSPGKSRYCCQIAGSRHSVLVGACQTGCVADAHYCQMYCVVG
jgi:anaphase-promoting complex subunit 1